LEIEPVSDLSESFTIELDQTTLEELQKRTPSEWVEYHEWIMREIFEILEQNGIVPLRWRTDESNQSSG